MPPCSPIACGLPFKAQNPESLGSGVRAATRLSLGAFSSHLGDKTITPLGKRRDLLVLALGPAGTAGENQGKWGGGGETPSARREEAERGQREARAFGRQAGTGGGEESTD